MHASNHVETGASVYELTVESEFSAAHRLVGYHGLCENLHGHNWQVETTVGSNVLNDLGMVMDFQDLKASLREILEVLDHKYLNDVPPFDEENPTTERLGRFIAEELDNRLPETVRVQRVRVWESGRSSATYLPGGPEGVVR
jgi:6-pyruvoyltetrahydropterin/6-carboxytetrahydropterin synthase